MAILLSVSTEHLLVPERAPGALKTFTPFKPRKAPRSGCCPLF